MRKTNYILVVLVIVVSVQICVVQASDDFGHGFSQPTASRISQPLRVLEVAATIGLAQSSTIPQSWPAGQPPSYVNPKELCVDPSIIDMARGRSTLEAPGLSFDSDIRQLNPEIMPNPGNAAIRTWAFGTYTPGFGQIAPIYRWSCTICLMPFAKKDDLVNHSIDEHEGAVMPFHCPEPGCTVKSKWKKDIKKHQTKHTKNKPFFCPTCHQRFSRNDNLGRHLRNQHPQRPTNPVEFAPLPVVGATDSGNGINSAASAASPSDNP